jgi:hypothetical protein
LLVVLGLLVLLEMLELLMLLGRRLLGVLVPQLAMLLWFLVILDL